MKNRSFAIRFGCSAAVLVVLSACGLSSAEPTRPTSAPASTAAPPPPANAPTTQPPAGLTDTTAPVQVVLDEYQAIAQKQYDQAYRLWAQNGAASGQTRSAFARGYANTAGLSVLLDRATAAVTPSQYRSRFSRCSISPTRPSSRSASREPTPCARRPAAGASPAQPSTKAMPLPSRPPAPVMHCVCCKHITRRSTRATIHAPTPTGRAMARPANNRTRCLSRVLRVLTGHTGHGSGADQCGSRLGVHGGAGRRARAAARRQPAVVLR